MIDTSMLNQNQKEAVLSDDKYLRIIAGAGSGKTRVLTMRIAHLIEDEDMRPYKILAITFTNKAANEMRERIQKMLGEDTVQPWISTVHSLCVRILREDIPAMGYPRNFTIMDAEDQKSVVKEAIRKLEINDSGLTPGSLIDYISNNKTADIDADQAMKMAGTYKPDVQKAKVYAYYLQRQKELHALDFDDLILWTVRMFNKFPDILGKWQHRFEYILVDEFQDIDATQYKLIRMLAGSDSCLYVVGDPDQTIYTWRGADVNIIMHFEKDYPGTKTIILNENYRSTMPILNAANSVIQNNRNRMKKDLNTNRKSSDKVIHYSAVNEENEADWIVSEIMRLHRKGKKYSDMAVLYRSNYLSRSLEKSFMNERIPYIIYGGIRFYERQEVKDMLCYLRMCTTADDLALERVLNRPKRGIGSKTMDAIAMEAETNGLTMYEVLKEDKIFTGKARKTIEAFVAMVEKWRRDMHSEEISDLFNEILKESGYEALLNADHEKGEERKQNLQALLDDIKEFSENYPDDSLDEYLQQVALYTDRESEQAADCVQLMTIHAAKGLEFDTVFISDLNEGIFPNERAMSDSSKGVEEERRLAYVAFTRARNRLYLCDAGGFSFVLQRTRTPSRFINEIDDQYIEHIGNVERKHHSLWDDEPKTDTSIQYHEPVNQEHRPHGGKIKKGDQVIHPKFGEGIVISLKGDAAKVAFAYPVGIKNIAVSFLKKKK